MSAIPPTLPPAPVPAPAPTAATVATPVAAVPAAIASLPPNSTIEATVVAQTAQAAAQAQAAAAQATSAQTQVRAALQLMTALGNLTVRLPMAVPPDASLRLQVMGTGPNLQLRLLAVNGQPVAAGASSAVADLRGNALATVAGSSAGAAPAGTALSGAAEQPAAAGGDTALQFDVPPATPTGGLNATIVFATDPALPNGTQLTVRLLDLEPPAPPGAGDEVAAQPEPSGAAAATNAEPAPAVPLAPGSSPAPGEPGVTDQDLAVANAADPGGTPSIAPEARTAPEGAVAIPTVGSSPAPPTATPAPSAVPATLAGMVAPNSLGGRTLLQTPIGLLSLDAGPELAAGSRVLLETVGPPQPPAAVAPSEAQALRGGPAPGWSAFSDAVAVLQKADPAAAAALVERLPDFGPQFVPNMVTWIAAASTGDMRSWLGDRTIKALEKAGRGDLIERLEGDMGEMRASVTLPQTSSAWQTVILPLFFGQQIERVRMTVRRTRGDDEDEGRDEEGTRFLVDVDMSRLGALQLDGLIKRRAKRFDLIVRSRRELPDQVQHDIGNIFARSLEGLGMTGGAVFKAAVAFVEPIPAYPTRAGLTI